jgi:AcrR family transcriptional regulator
MPVMATAPPLSRRDRVRAATTQEIVQTARKLLVDEGPAAISLRAIAREMGMTAPALYRYFGSHEDLLQAVVGNIFGDLTAHVRSAIHAVDGAGLPQAELMAEKLMAGCREFRAWALAHVPEFEMIFGNRLPGLDIEVLHTDHGDECGLRFGQVFLELFGELYRKRPFPIASDEDVSPGLREELGRYRQLTGSDLPLGALQTFLQCWVILYGSVGLEVSGHLRFALVDATPLFELMLSDLAGMVGLHNPVAGKIR